MKCIAAYSAAIALYCRSPCGERGLKCCIRRGTARPPGRRSPCGERGLKLSARAALCTRVTSLPVRGAWIEMGLSIALIAALWLVAPRAGSVD